MPQGGGASATGQAGNAPQGAAAPAKGGEKKSKTPALDHFCRDLTALAAEGQLDPTIGRAKEIERVMEVLTRRKKNNPVLIGEPGVGKTAIVEGLAQRIAVGDAYACMAEIARLIDLQEHRPAPHAAGDGADDRGEHPLGIVNEGGIYDAGQQHQSLRDGQTCGHRQAPQLDDLTTRLRRDGRQAHDGDDHCQQVAETQRCDHDDAV